MSSRGLSEGESESGLVGGGWLACFGYDPKTTTMAFYDSLLRWQEDSGWRFESLGIEGREHANAAALEYWTAALSAASSQPTEPVQIGTFGVSMGAADAQDRYLAAVENVISRIDHGHFYQLNLCIRLHAPVRSTAPAVFGQLCDRLQPAYGGLITGPMHRGSSRMITSFSPELFLRIRDRTVLTAPIKGTAPRGAGDSGLAALRASTKDAAENVMIVDLMRNDLSRVCRPGTVAVQDLLTIQPHPGVWHLVSAVRGELEAETTVADVLGAAFPPGSVTGAPKIAAQHGIADLEDEPRGAYTGSIGLVSPLAGADFNVIIRSFELADGRLQLGVGGGITVDSVPDAGVVRVLAQGGTAGRCRRIDALIMNCLPSPWPRTRRCWRPGSSSRSWSREARSFVWLPILPAWTDRAASCTDTGFQMILLARRTTLVQRHAEPASARPPHSRPAHRRWAGRQAGRSPARSDGRSARRCGITRGPIARGDTSGSSGRRWTWQRRRSVPICRSSLRRGGMDITETSRGNIFIQDQHGSWCTPPLDEHVLPGITRREVIDLLDEQRTPVVIRRCSLQDLLQSRGAFWTSSLSGAVPITAVDGTPLPNTWEFTNELNGWLSTS